MIKKNLFTIAVLYLVSLRVVNAQPVINEIHYHPDDDPPTEFIELYNPTNATIDVSGYAFTDGVEYTIPNGTSIPARGYLLVVEDPTHNLWGNRSRVGPWSGQLDNGGEKLDFRSNTGTLLESIRYSDTFPWSRGADGYGPSLERISPDLPGNDYRSWRTSLQTNGTPGAANTVTGVPPRPMISTVNINPPFPASSDTVTVDIGLDGVSQISKVELQVNVLSTQSLVSEFTLEMTKIRESNALGIFQATIDKQSSQSLVRFSVKVTLTGNQTVILPHRAEPRPFDSYFVYDNDIESKLPILWIFPLRVSSLTESNARYAATVIKPLDSDFPLLYDSIGLETSRNGQKLRFLKGEEWEGNRTLNVIPEAPPAGTTAGPQSPHVEEISFDIQRDFGVLAPKSDWMRVIERGSHTQRIYIQQPNENFLELNGRDRDGNLYKIAYNEPGGYSKKTNIYEPSDDYTELFRNVNTGNRRNLGEMLRRHLKIDKVLAYETLLMLMSHWDGIKNNMFIYHDPDVDQWEIIPWDMDKTFGYTDSNPFFWQMPLDFLLTGVSPGSQELTGRNLNGPISRPFHMDPELNQMFLDRVKKELNGLFSEERIIGLIDAKEQLLLEDLELLERYTNQTRNSRRNQIRTAYQTMRQFTTLRNQFLRSQFPANFSSSRTVPVTVYKPGETLRGITVTFTPDPGETFNVEIGERVPDGFQISEMSVTGGEVSILENQIIYWKLDNVSSEMKLTYNVTVPVNDPPVTAEFNGIVVLGEIPYSTEPTTIRLFNGLKPEWVIGSAGQWAVVNGILRCVADTGADPKHAWVDLDLDTGDYTVQADVRMVNWENTDHARAGIAVRVNPNDGERALNLLFHDDTDSVDMLNDLVAWGARSDFSWTVGEWYTMTLTADGNLLRGGIRPKGSNNAPRFIEWEDTRHSQRSPGYPGLTGSTMQGLTAEFDNFSVTVDGDVVFADDFEVETNVSEWELY